MLAVDETAVVCDLAETYHIYNMDALPARTVATLACGLKPDSRIKTKMVGLEITPPNVLLMALLVDELRVLRYQLFGAKNDKPTFVTEIMQNAPKEETKAFETGADFDAFYKSIIERAKK